MASRSTKRHLEGVWNKHKVSVSAGVPSDQLAFGKASEQAKLMCTEAASSDGPIPRPSCRLTDVTVGGQKNVAMFRD